MPADQTGLVAPGGPPPTLQLGQDSPVTSGGKPPMTKNQKTAYVIGGFAVVAIALYLYEKHKSSSSTANTTPMVIAPSTPASNQDTMPNGYNSVGSGGGNLSGSGSLAAQLAAIQTELQLLATGQSPTPGSPTSPLSPYPGLNPGGVAIPAGLGTFADQATLAANQNIANLYGISPNPQSPNAPTIVPNTGTADLGILGPGAVRGGGAVVGPGPAITGPSWNQVTQANNDQNLASAQSILGFTGPFSSLTPAQQQQAIMTAAI